jgi:hypothetical protein
MGDVAVRQQAEVSGRQILRVADLDRVAESLRKCREDGGEPRVEVPRRGEGRLVEGPELEDQRADSLPVGFQPAGEESLKRLRVEEVGIPLAGPRPLAGVLRPVSGRDVLGHLVRAIDGCEVG